MGSERGKLEFRSASERLGLALDRLEAVLEDQSLQGDRGDRIVDSELRDQALAMADQASVAVDAAVSDLRVVLGELASGHGRK